MSDIDQTMRFIEQWEGRRDTVYTDTEGNATIGVGFNLTREDARERIEALGLDYDQVLSGQQTLSDEQIDQLLQHDAEQAMASARDLVQNFDNLPEDAQTIVIDMVFNLGREGFAGFTNTIDALENNDFTRAAAEMRDSRWFDQVGDRSEHHVTAIESLSAPTTGTADQWLDLPDQSTLSDPWAGTLETPAAPTDMWSTTAPSDGTGGGAGSLDPWGGLADPTPASDPWANTLDQPVATSDPWGGTLAPDVPAPSTGLMEPAPGDAVGPAPEPDPWGGLSDPTPDPWGGLADPTSAPDAWGGTFDSVPDTGGAAASPDAGAFTPDAWSSSPDPAPFVDPTPDPAPPSTPDVF